jgi:formate dehydrogenase assembly factor FdhD
MKDFDRHSKAMLTLLEGYATREGIINDMSGLLIIREVSTDPSVKAETLQMSIQGEDPPVAIQTIHTAAKILANELVHMTKTNGVPAA